MAEIHVNREKWEELSADEQQSVEQALKDAGTMTDADTLIPSDDVPEMMLPDADFVRNVAPTAAADPACERACNAAYAAAVSRCNLLPHPAARAVCYGAATAAYAVCLRNC